MEIVDEQVINYDLVEDLLTLMFVEKDQNNIRFTPFLRVENLGLFGQWKPSYPH